MEDAITSESGLRSFRRRRLLLLAVVLAVVASSAAFLSWRTSPTESIQALGFRSADKNVGTQVRYVGDEACIGCHAQIAETYRRHPMGRSLAPIKDAVESEGGPGNDRPHFVAKGLQYSVEYREGRVIHQEARQDASGRKIAQIDAEVQYVIGSGRQAFSYLIERDGFLFESPITQYAKDARWGLSPGYETRTSSFDRPILPDCLFCHTNRVEPVTSAINRYRTPIFHGYAIGCERCHGPGELHVRRPELVDGRDATIVNPANLEPSLRDAVCEQCHLLGTRRVVRANARSEDYRPGLPFYRFWSMYVPDASGEDNRFASQPEQMQTSRCFRASQGRLGCISCHDPHVFPTAAEKTAYFRDRCLECHADRGCRLAVKVRLERKGGDDCVSCHMPRQSSSNNPHVATTNHRIPRHADQGPQSPVPNDPHRPRRASLVNFHRALMEGDDLARAERDRGVALCRGGGDGALTEALPLLKMALEKQPDDLPARECLGEVLGRLGRAEEGLAAYRLVLSKEPARQTALEGAAHLAAQASRPRDAIAYWRQAIAINPWRSAYFAELARVSLQVRDWAAAAQACEQSLRLNPSSVQVRKWLVQSDLHLGNQGAARREFEILLGFDPPDRDALIRWFTPLAPKL